MEKIKATYVPVVGEDEEATIIDVFLNKNICEALWVNNEGNLHYDPISAFKVDMDSFTGRKEKQKTLALVEMLYHAFVNARE